MGLKSQVAAQVGRNRSTTPPPNFSARSNALQRGAEYRRSAILLDQDVQGTEYVLKGRTQLLGAGEATLSLTFPVTYIEPPNFTSGWELDAGTSPQAGQFPIVSCGVSLWGPNGEGPIMPDTVDGGTYSLRTWYTGAIIVCVATGPAAQNIWIHWRFEGVALSNPINNSINGNSTVEGTV